jgi:uncharacterized membrane protein YcaP (DUF421 family)
MRAERVTPEEVLAAVRPHGAAGLEEVDAVVLETDGSFTTIRRADLSGMSLRPLSKGPFANLHRLQEPR